MSEPHEKYVSIEFDKWENYYKILEDINKDLQYQVDHKDIKIYVWRATGFGNGTWDYIGDLQLQIDGGQTIEGFKKDYFVSLIQQKYGLRLFRTDEDVAREDEVLKAVKRIVAIPRIIRWLFKIKIPK